MNIKGFFRSKAVQEEYDREGRSRKFDVGTFHTKDAPDGTITNESILTEGSGPWSVDRRGVRYKDPNPVVIRDILNVATTQNGSVAYIEETGFCNAVVYATGATVEEYGDTGKYFEIPVGSTAGLYEGQKVTITDADGDNPLDVTIVTVGTDSLTFAEDLGEETYSEGAEICAETFTYTAETKLKPQATPKFEPRSTNVKTIAHWVPVSRQALSDLEGLQNYIEGRLVEGLKNAEEAQVLFGEGGPDQLDGIVNNPRIHDYKWSNGVAGDTKTDAIRRGMSLVAGSQYESNAAIVSPKDLEEIELTKTKDGQYVIANVQGRISQRLFNCQVYVSRNMPYGKALVGDFRNGATLWDRMQSTVMISDSHEDYFARNMLAILAEERVALTVQRPEAFVYVDFDNKPS